MVFRLRWKKWAWFIDDMMWKERGASRGPGVSSWHGGAVSRCCRQGTVSATRTAAEANRNRQRCIHAEKQTYAFPRRPWDHEGES